MKKLIIVLIVSTIAITGFGQNKNIPDAVSNHFKSTYPNAQDTDWDRENDSTYSVEFKSDGKKWEAYYAADNSWIRTERDVSKNDVPQAVWDALSKSEYAAWKIDDIEEHQTPQHPSVYEVEVEKDGQEVYLNFLPDGTMVK
jgi:hypothetical protein